MGNSSAQWIDSAIRLQVGLMTQITYLTTAGSTDRERVMVNTNVPSTFNLLPQAPNSDITYGGSLAPAGWYIALVDVELESYNPC
jgi:hypothetical protein